MAASETTVPFLRQKLLSYQKEETSKTDNVVDEPGTLFF